MSFPKIVVYFDRFTRGEFGLWIYLSWREKVEVAGCNIGIRKAGISGRVSGVYSCRLLQEAMLFNNPSSVRLFQE
jgi:hypothetical protein